MDWDTLIDAANLVTMACAVIGVVLAAVLGWVAIHVSTSGNDTARYESLYGQVDDVLNAALRLTAASSDADDKRELDRAREAFGSRLRVLAALGSMPGSEDAVEESRVFADSLVSVSYAHNRLRRDGRTVLSETLLSGEKDDHTADLLKCWTARYCEVAIPEANYNGDPLTLERTVVDHRLVPPSFEESQDRAAALKRSLGEISWAPRASDSLRVLFPWVQAAVGVVSVGETDGEPAMLLSTRPYPEQTYDENLQLIGDEEPPWPQESLSNWLDQWSPDSVYVDINGPIEVRFSPEAMSAQLLTDLRAAFLERIVKMVSNLRAAVNETHKAEAGWMRRTLKLA